MRRGCYSTFPCLIVLLCGILAAPHTAALGQANPPAAKEASQKTPPALTHYLGREIATTMHYSGAPWLVRESRQRDALSGTDFEKAMATKTAEKGPAIKTSLCAKLIIFRMP